MTVGDDDVAPTEFIVKIRACRRWQQKINTFGIKQKPRRKLPKIKKKIKKKQNGKQKKCIDDIQTARRSAARRLRPPGKKAKKSFIDLSTLAFLAENTMSVVCIYVHFPLAFFIVSFSRRRTGAKAGVQNRQLAQISIALTGKIAFVFDAGASRFGPVRFCCFFECTTAQPAANLIPAAAASALPAQIDSGDSLKHCSTKSCVFPTRSFCWRASVIT